MRMNKKIRRRIRLFAPYVAASVIIIALLGLGSANKTTETGSTPFMSQVGDNNFIVTSDQLSESFIVADLANSVRLPSADAINENYVTIAIKHEVSQINDSKIEKPIIVDTSHLSRGIVEYIVSEGESLENIAGRYGLSTDQVRWSNGLKTSSLTAGQKLFIPTVPGILYTIKNGDTLDSLAGKYKSNAEQIVLYNDLETSGFEVGKTIILPSGELPETERPEYVAPVVRPTYTAPRIPVGNSSFRQNMREVQNYGYWRGVYNATRSDGNPGAFGNCTWFAWYWRRHNMPGNYHLPGGVLGNARDWTRTLGGSFYIDQTPRSGDVVQTSSSGAYGHVAIVEAVHADGSITIIEMNTAGLNRVFRSEVAASVAKSFNYIHQHK